MSKRFDWMSHLGFEVVSDDIDVYLDIEGDQREADQYHSILWDVMGELKAQRDELLEAAKLVLAWYEAEENHGDTDFFQRMQMCRESEDAVRAAIAKATATGEAS